MASKIPVTSSTWLRSETLSLLPLGKLLQIVFVVNGHMYIPPPPHFPPPSFLPPSPTLIYIFALKNTMSPLLFKSISALNSFFFVFLFDFSLLNITSESHVHKSYARHTKLSQHVAQRIYKGCPLLAEIQTKLGIISKWRDWGGVNKIGFWGKKSAKYLIQKSPE